MLIERSVESAVREDAARAARSWASYFAQSFDGLENVLADGQLDDRQKAFIQASARIGQVFRFKLFDAHGRLVLVSDQTEQPIKPASLRDHNPAAVEAIESGREIVSVEENLTASNRPALYAEAYVR